MTATQSGHVRCLQGRVHIDNTSSSSLLPKLWKAHQRFNGQRSGGGVRDFTRTFMKALRGTLPVPAAGTEGAQALAAYTRVMLALGAQAAPDFFNKASGPFRSDKSLRSVVLQFQKRQAEKVADLSKLPEDEETDADPPVVREHRRKRAEELVSDCDLTLRCVELFAAHEWWPFAALKSANQAAGSYYYTELLKQAVAHVASYVELRILDTEAELIRQLRIQAWTAQSDDHHRYFVSVRPTYVRAEHSGSIRGHAGRLTGRTLAPKYLTWLRENTQLVKWRTPDAEFVDLDDEAKGRVAAAPERKRTAVELAELLRANPELALLDRIHGDFDSDESGFVIRRRGRLLSDNEVNFTTYTEPEAVHHPRGFVFSAPQSMESWKDLQPGGVNTDLWTVSLLLPTEDGGSEWTKVAFHPDKRLQAMYKLERQGKAFCGQYRDPHTNRVRTLSFSGIRLRFSGVRLMQGKIESASVYLDFVVSRSRRKQSSRATKAEWVKPRKADPVQLSRLRLVPQTRVGTVVFDPQSFAWVTCGTVEEGSFVKNGSGFRTRLINPLGQLVDEIRRQERIIRDKKDSSGGMPRGRQFAPKAHERLRNLRDQLRRAGVADVVSFLLGKEVVLKRRGGSTEHARGRLGASVEVVVIASADYEKVFGGQASSLNRQRANYAVATVNELLKRSLEEQGIKVLEVKRYGYSLQCSKCGALGLRYYLSKPRSGPRELVFSPSGNKFACGACATVEVDARYNASSTLLQACTQPEFLLPYRKFRALDSSARSEWTQQQEAVLRPLILKALGLC
ncbi:MAG: hypothetical protein KDD69_15575 [Bdellovibrionales bacterium]|nr:hypothetical protein [Bdellovibrionales bacterium]